MVSVVRLAKQPKKKQTEYTQNHCDLIVFKWRAYHVGALRGKDVVWNKIL